MTMIESDAMRQVRAQLCERIDGIAGTIARQDAPRLCANVDGVGALAAAHGIGPVEQLAHALEGLIARGAGGAAVIGYLDLMRDAAACGRSDAAATEAFAAAAAQRYR